LVWHAAPSQRTNFPNLQVEDGFDIHATNLRITKIVNRFEPQPYRRKDASTPVKPEKCKGC